MAYDYGAVLASGRPEAWGDVLSQIERHDLYTGEDGTYGLETNPHVTVLYGLHEEVHEDLACRMCQTIDLPIEARVKGFSTFETDDFDVLKYDIESKRLRSLNKAFCSLPHTNKHGDYEPHMTVAYLKKGHAPKYSDMHEMIGETVELNELDFTPAGAEGPVVRVRNKRRQKT